jgi:hypothetical protein
VLATIDVIEFGFSNAIIDVNGWEEEFVFSLKFIKTRNTSGSFL